MRIAVVGGMERHETEIARRASALGHEVEFHRGRVGGRGAGELEAIVWRADLVVVVTGLNSHGAMYLAKRTAARGRRPALIARTCSPSSFSAILASLSTKPAAAASPLGA
jgi:hypothetical protein